VILKATRIAAASGPDAWIRHVLHGKENERISLVYGSEMDVRSAFEDARLAGSRYGIRHWTINPGEPCDRKAAERAVARLAREFGFDPRTTVIVEHQKRRADGQGYDVHWHVAVPEYDPVRRRVLNSRWDRPRHEKIARILEAELGHQFTQGAHARAVAQALEAEGRNDVARALKDAGHLDGSRPRASFDSDRHQQAKRTGVSLPEARAAVRNAWQQSDGPEALNAALAERGLQARPGDKAGTWIVVSAADGQFIGAVHRLAGVRIADVRARLSTSTETDHDPERSRRPPTRTEGRRPADTASVGRAGVPDEGRREHDPSTPGGRGSSGPERGPLRAVGPSRDRNPLDRAADREQAASDRLTIEIDRRRTAAERKAFARRTAVARLRHKLHRHPEITKRLRQALDILDPARRKAAALRRLDRIEDEIRSEIAARPDDLTAILEARSAREHRQVRQAAERVESARLALVEHQRSHRPTGLLSALRARLYDRRTRQLERQHEQARGALSDARHALDLAETRHRAGAHGTVAANRPVNDRARRRADVLAEARSRIAASDIEMEIAAVHGTTSHVVALVERRRSEEARRDQQARREREARAIIADPADDYRPPRPRM
jgi:hypothetical protein